MGEQHRAKGIKRVLLSHRELGPQQIIIPPSWSQVAETISLQNGPNHPIVLVCGPKNAGKSTFSRYLINTLLNSRYQRVGYLDTDVGQPEYTPPGCLSLHVIDTQTPDLAVPCLKTPERCFFYGDISSKRDPDAYLDCVFNLYNYFREEYKLSNEQEFHETYHLPLVVNTPGWVKGVGYDILVNMLRYIGPTHVVRIQISDSNKNLPAGAFWFGGDEERPVDLINIDSAQIDSLNRSVLVQKHGRLVRELRIIAYFKQCFSKDLNITAYKELANALASLPPYEVPISSMKVLHLHCQVPSSEVFYSLNGTIVGLSVSSTKSGKCRPLCVGLGIVRGIDILKGLYYVITPVSPRDLEKVDLFLQGLIEIPTCLLQVKGCVSPYMSTNVLTVTT
ncbi:polynucleotide 5'-hydroxyl-kinase NOL9 [Amborella trichopoda]|uniref:polynucleotide 5'-hydroxyl-kinase NOL9 n=1 Tax=Amborella trichopoda TaxID=13333 RepID=UPI0005D3D6F7|nr:polynucleotide 5'-hydroxyl-kinase NOL9 [Amborella trichopoda]|eukprot:XP_011622893.1 polynucleotide 5'-hydroxyl-kinase NOL9 [Amborella trichopoda]